MALLFKTTALAEPTGDSLYALTARTITGEEQPLSTYAGQVALVVNTASKCGFTSQYEGLEKLYDQYRERGFVILGFPSNDFGSQEPGSNDDIQRFCKLNYGVSFPLFEKNPVSGPAKQEVYKLLTERAPGFEGDPGWNFVKFLVNKDGKVVARFASVVTPTSKKLQKEIEKWLTTPAQQSPSESAAKKPDEVDSPK